MAAPTTPQPISPRSYSLRPGERFVPAEEYLRTGYEPDMDYVDGHLEERNLGEFEHSQWQRALLVALDAHAREWGVRVLPECRLQVRPDRFRVPDIMVLRREDKPERVVTTAPLLCIEILSAEDTFSRILSRVDDYAAMGVQNVWVLDPSDGRVFTHAQGERRWITERILKVEGTGIAIDLDRIQADLAD